MIADLFRYLWGLLYWNTRKSLFRMRPERFACPCQSPSDSGRGFETRCEAAMVWAKPIRFRRVCPLLVQTPAGLRCSVDTPRVRPFWGRAVGFYLGGAVGIYLFVAIAGFAALRGIGYPVTFLSVAWPPRWNEINPARARFFMEKGAAALRENNTREALAAFSVAYDLAPLDYEIAFAAASIWQVTHPKLSDDAFILLLLNHPESRDRTADAWHRALLARGDYVQVRELARRELTRPEADPGHGPYWMNSLLFATAQLADAATLQQLAADGSGLPPQFRRLVQTELLARGTPADRLRAVAALRDPWPEAAHRYIAYYQVDRLIRLNQMVPAATLAGRLGIARLGDDSWYRLELDILAISGPDAAQNLNAVVGRLLNTPSAPVIELLAIHLARHPNRQAMAQTLDRLRAAPLPAAPRSNTALVSLFCAAGVAGDAAAMDEIAAILRTNRGTPGPSMDAAREFFLEKPQRRAIGLLLPSLPLPLELTYVLLERYPLGTSAVPATAER